MEALFASGHAVDIVLVVIAIEAGVLFWRSILRPFDIVTMLLPAVLILLGLRAALVGADWPWIATPLALAFPVHLADLLRRRAQAV